MRNCQLNDAHAGMQRLTNGLRRGLLVFSLLGATTAAQATVVYTLYQSADGSGPVAATLVAPSGLIQDTSDWTLTQIIPNAGNPLPNFNLNQPVAVQYADPYCGLNYCLPGQAWVWQELGAYSNRIHFSLTQTVFNIPGPDLPISDGLYPIWGDHDAYYNHAADCLAGECNWTSFRSMRITGTENPVPEPGSLALLAVGLTALTVRRRRLEASNPPPESQRLCDGTLTA